MANSLILSLIDSNITLCLSITFVLIILRSYLTRSKNKVLSLLPGPPSLPVVGNALLLAGPPEEVWLPTMKKLRKKYGPVVRFSFGNVLMVIIFAPQDFEKVLSSNVHITKGCQYDFFWPWLGQGLLTSTGSHWKTHRKLLTPAFHYRILEDFLHTINDQAKILCSKLKTQVDGKLVNLYPYITHCSLDIICETAMGQKINCQRDCNSPYVKAVYQCQTLLFHRMMSPWLWNDFIFGLTPCGRNLSKCLATIHGFTQTVIKKRKIDIDGKAGNDAEDHEVVDNIGRKQRLSFLDLLIEASKDGKDLTDQDIREEVNTFMFEGHDTTASNISLTLYLLAHHTEAQVKCQQELDQIFLNSDRPTTSADLNEMKYLHCCIKESLRLYPSVPSITRKTGEPVQLGGYLIPANTEIYLNIAVLHRDPDTFLEPERFIPERFSAENESSRHPYAYVPFSAGPRNCIGQKFAMMEEKVVISTVLRNFHLKTDVAIEDIPLLPELVFKPRDGLFVRLRPRK